MQVKVKKLNENAVIPAYAKAGDAGLDLVATSYEFKNGRHVYGTGLAFEIPEGYVGLVFPRSSICKYDLALTNSVGVIDSGYRGEVMAQFAQDDSELRGSANFFEDNHIHFPVIYNVGDKICQLLILPYPQIELLECEELSDTVRGQSGFGSSGT